MSRLKNWYLRNYKTLFIDLAFICGVALLFLSGFHAGARSIEREVCVSEKIVELEAKLDKCSRHYLLCEAGCKP